MKETSELTAKEVEQMIKKGKVEYINIDEKESVPDFYTLETPIVVGDLLEEKDEPQIIREVEFELDESKIINI